jgi:hypothetical protein
MTTYSIKYTSTGSLKIKSLLETHQEQAKVYPLRFSQSLVYMYLSMLCAPWPNHRTPKHKIKGTRETGERKEKESPKTTKPPTNHQPTPIHRITSHSFTIPPFPNPLPPTCPPPLFPFCEKTSQKRSVSSPAPVTIVPPSGLMLRYRTR